MMKGICPGCEKVTELEYFKGKEPITIKHKTVMVNAEYYTCLECNKDFEDPKSEIDSLEEAYKLCQM